MRPSRHCMRTLIAAVVLLLATLLSVECASAQVFPERARAVTSAEAPSTPVAQHQGRRRTTADRGTARVTR